MKKLQMKMGIPFYNNSIKICADILQFLHITLWLNQSTDSHTNHLNLSDDPMLREL